MSALLCTGRLLGTRCDESAEESVDHGLCLEQIGKRAHRRYDRGSASRLSRRHVGPRGRDE
jgi:hypothetical protein